MHKPEGHEATALNKTANMKSHRSFQHSWLFGKHKTTTTKKDILKHHSMFCLRCCQHNLLLRSVSAQDTQDKGFCKYFILPVIFSDKITPWVLLLNILSMINTKPSIHFTLQASVLHWHSSVVSQLRWKWARTVWLHHYRKVGFSRLWMLPQILRGIETFINSTSTVGKCNLLLQSWI